MESKLQISPETQKLIDGLEDIKQRFLILNKNSKNKLEDEDDGVSGLHSMAD